MWSAAACRRCLRARLAPLDPRRWQMRGGRPGKPVRQTARHSLARRLLGITNHQSLPTDHKSLAIASPTPMSIESFSPLPLNVFGTWVTLLDPSDVPPGMSPNLGDVDFFPGGVRTRPGLVSQFPVIGGAPQINGLKTYITTNLAPASARASTRSAISTRKSSPGVLSHRRGRRGVSRISYLASTTHFRPRIHGVWRRRHRPGPAAPVRRHELRPRQPDRPRRRSRRRRRRPPAAFRPACISAW